MELRTTQEGILRAFALLVGQASKQRQVKPKYRDEKLGTKIHAVRHLKAHEREAVDELVVKLKSLNSADDNNNDEEIRATLKELSKHPVKFVPVLHAIKLDRSKTYPYRSKKRGG
jgi:hypothetical protein